MKSNRYFGHLFGYLFGRMFGISLLSLAFCFSCSKVALSDDPAPLTEKPGYDHQGKLTPQLNPAQQTDFFNFMQDSARVEESVNLASNSAKAGEAITSADAKTLHMANQIQSLKCVLAPVDSSMGHDNVQITASGATCPVQMNFILSTTKQDSGEIFSINLTSEIIDAGFKTSNDVFKQSAAGSGSNVITGPINDSTHTFTFEGTGQTLSISRGMVTVLRTIKSKSQLKNGNLETSQTEEIDEFQFKDYKVVLQSSTVKNSQQNSHTEHYFNGNIMNPEVYRQLMRGLGSQSLVANKL